MLYDWDWVAAESHLRKSVTLNPNDATAEQWLGELYCYRRQFDSCRRPIRHRVGAPTRSLRSLCACCRAHPISTRDGSRLPLPPIDVPWKRYPGSLSTHFPLGHAYVGLESWDQAISSYEASMPDLGMAIVAGPLIFSHARGGDIDRAEALLEELEEHALERYVPPSKFAIAHLGLGDRAEALSWLWRAVEERDDRLVYVAVDSVYSELFSEPEFQRIAQKIGLAEVIAAD